MKVVPDPGPVDAGLLSAPERHYRGMSLSRRAILRLAIAAAGATTAGCTRGPGIIISTPATQNRTPVDSPPPSSSSSSSSSSAPAVSPARGGTTARPRPRGTAVQRAHGTRTRDEVALTFHGAGELTIARQLLSIFAHHQASVTVLAVGTWLAAHPTIAREIIDAGHELGNHTWSHQDIDSLNADQAREEITRCRDLLLTQVGSGGEVFRQSQSPTATDLVRQLAGAAGYPTCLSYDVDSLDYTDPGPSAVRSNVAAAQPGSIVSLHFGHAGTVAAMPGILNDLHARGLSPVTASRLLRT